MIALATEDHRDLAAFLSELEHINSEEPNPNYMQHLSPKYAGDFMKS